MSVPLRHSTNLDRLRLVAITDIVLYHVNYFEPRYLLGSGLPTFLVAATFLGCTHPQPRPWLTVVRPRIKRIIVPWLFWSLIFGISLGLREAVFNEWKTWWKPFEPLMLAYGTAIHLWFLPFIFLVGLAVRGLHGLTWRLPWQGVVVVGLLAAAGWSMTASPLQWKFPWDSWWFGFTCIPLGIVVGRLVAEDRIRHRLVPVLAIVVVAASVAFLILHGLSPPIGRFGLALGLVLLALHYPSRPDPITSTLTPLIYGVFLVHPLVLLFVHDVTPGTPSYEVLAVCGLVGSAALVWLLRWTPIRKFM